MLTLPFVTEVKILKNIPITKPSITSLEKKYCADAIENGWGSNCYDYILKFEKQFSEFCGSRFSIATSSCTGALFLALSSIGLCADDEVILCDINWIATVSPVVHLGAKPVFVDILPDSWCISPKGVKEAITTKTKVIIATHLYGNICELEELRAIADENNLFLIEDAAEAFGSKLNGKQVGVYGDIGVFSFHGTKTISTGEGGMLITNNEQIYEKAVMLNNHGRAAGEQKQFWSEAVGYKFKMSNVQAAMGLAQLERAKELIQRKRDIFLYYQKKLDSFDDLQMNIERRGSVNSFWMPTVVWNKNLKICRKDVLENFRCENIDARVFFWPLSSMPMFMNKPDNWNAYCISERGINLPSYYDMTENELDKVIRVLLHSLRL